MRPTEASSFFSPSLRPLLCLTPATFYPQNRAFHHIRGGERRGHKNTTAFGWKGTLVGWLSVGREDETSETH